MFDKWGRPGWRRAVAEEFSVATRNFSRNEADVDLPFSFFNVGVVAERQLLCAERSCAVKSYVIRSFCRRDLRRVFKEYYIYCCGRHRNGKRKKCKSERRICDET